MVEDLRSESLVPVPEADSARRFSACLLAGAVGDMLGAPVEYLRLPEIRIAYGEAGIRGPASAYGRVGSIADSTQLSLFTAEGLIEAVKTARPRSGRPPFEVAVGHAYLRWLHTQGVALPAGVQVSLEGGLLAQPALFAQRTPSLTCLDALELMDVPGRAAANSRRSNNCVARSAPVGLVYAEAAALDESLRRECLLTAMRLAGLTHGDPSAQVAAGAFAVIIAQLAVGMPLTRALPVTLGLLRACDQARGVSRQIEQAVGLANRRPASVEALVELGEGWDADQALAIALYCALSAPDPRTGLLLAVNQPGDSDACAALLGHLYGCQYGMAALPPEWLEVLELREVIGDVAAALHTAAQYFATSIQDKSPSLRV